MGRCAQRYTTRRYFFLTPFQAVRFTSKLSWLYCEIGLVKTVKYVPSRLYSRVLQAQTIDGRFFRVAACFCSPQPFVTAWRQRQRLWCERSCARACITRQRQCGSARAAGSLEAAHQARPRRAGGRAGPGLQRGRGGCSPCSHATALWGPPQAGRLQQQQAFAIVHCNNRKLLQSRWDAGLRPFGGECAGDHPHGSLHRAC
jgi:hypothetical protein